MNFNSAVSTCPASPITAAFDVEMESAKAFPQIPVLHKNVSFGAANDEPVFARPIPRRPVVKPSAY